jgi:capsular exopolysaccharide synthesis family protein
MDNRKLGLPYGTLPEGASGYPQTVQYATPGGESGADLRTIVRALRHKWWLPVTLALLGLIAGYQYMRQQVPLYQAVATVRLSGPRASMGAVVGTEMSGGSPRADPLLSQMVVLRGRTFLGHLADQSGMRLAVDPAESTLTDAVSHIEWVALPDSATGHLRIDFDSSGLSVFGPARATKGTYGDTLSVDGFVLVAREPVGQGVVKLEVLPRNYAIDVLAHGLNPSVRPGTDAIDLAFVSSDAAQAIHLANSAAQVFQAFNAQSLRQNAVRGRIFIEEQLRAAESHLAIAQSELTRFRSTKRLHTSSTRIQQLQAELLRLNEQREGIVADQTIFEVLLARLADANGSLGQTELHAIIISPEIAANEMISDVVREMQSLAAVRDSLLSEVGGLTPIHPLVIRIDTLQQIRHQRLMESLRGQLRSLQLRLSPIEVQRAAALEGLRSLPGDEAEELRLIQQVDASQIAVTEMQAEYRRGRIAEAIEGGQVEVLSLAVAALPIRSAMVLRMALGPVIGLLIGGAIAVLIESLNQSIRRREQLEQDLGVRKLAVIPSIVLAQRRAWPRKSGAPKIAADRNGHAAEPEQSDGLARNGRGVSADRLAVEPIHAVAAEAFRTLRTNLLFSPETRDVRTIVVTSARAGEGKTTTAVNLAVCLAQQGMRILLIDADLRQPRVHEVLGIEREPGLAELFALHRRMAVEMIKPTSLRSLHVLTCGQPIPNPPELLSGSRMEGILQWLSREYDRVIVDVPPVLGASEASALAARADGVLLVVCAGETDRESVREALYQLQIVGANVMGAVLNDPKRVMPRYEGRPYQYYVHPD